jgi:dTDP-4-amino-4,6-dideoxygalactose transaminase
MYGETSRYRSEEIAGVSRLDELQAAVLSVKLRYLDGWVARRREIAERYMVALRGVGDIRFVGPSVWGKSAFHLCVIRSSMRDALQSFLAKRGCGSAIHYPVPIHLTPSFAALGYKQGDFPETEDQCRSVLSLPIYPELTDSEVDSVACSVADFFASKHG